jgi:hypothetical protein
MPDAFSHSAELRWFLPTHDRWNELLKWFTKNGELLTFVENADSSQKTPTDLRVIKELQRTDSYLLLDGSDTVGVKQRQGRLEIKAIVSVPRPFALAGVTGRVDQWVKWSFKPADSIAQQLENGLEQSGPWCKVEKQRCLQKYSLDSGSPEAVSPKSFPITGCNIELTQLKADAKSSAWITFGFEAFGKSAKVLAALHDAMETYFKVHNSPPVPLEGRDSLSYPSWLAVLR